MQVLCEDKKQRSSSVIFKQILDLKRLSLAEGNSRLPMIRQQEEITSTHCLPKELDESLEQNLKRLQSQGLATDLQQIDNTLQESTLVPLLSPFSQREHVPLNGESFCQCKSPAQSNQVWSNYPKLFN